MTGFYVAIAFFILALLLAVLHVALSQTGQG